MAICNLFNKFTNVSGNFMMFSQYVEDVTRTYVENDKYKVVPTKFIALDIDYKNIDYKSTGVIPNNDYDLNTGIPMYFQNYYENGCAYGRSNIENWTPEDAKNLFWNAVVDGGFITKAKLNEDIKIAKEIMYVGDINMHSYNSHKGMGYGEIYCYIPTNAQKSNIEIKDNYNETSTRIFTENENSYLEGYNTVDYTSFSDKMTAIGIGEYSKKYYYNKDYSFSFDDERLNTSENSLINKYCVNTVIVLYSVFTKFISSSDNSISWEPIYENIPLGLYITGMFDDNNDLTNNITKYVTTSYGSGTSYGLRICNRFTVSSAGAYLNDSEIITDNSNYINTCQLMTAMNENLSKMLDICKSVQNTTQSYKDTLSIIKNNRTNVPYVKEINGKDYWFVNGKLVSVVDGSNEECCNTISTDVIKKRINNIMDENINNDFDYIEDPNSGCECYPLSNKDLANRINEFDADYDFIYDGPDYGGGTTGGNTPPKPLPPIDCEIDIAEDKEVICAFENINGCNWNE